MELVFDDNSSLIFKLNDDDSGIKITSEFEFEKYKASLQTEFLQQIRLQKIEASSVAIWKSALPSSFQEITAIREKGQFLSTTFWIAFKNQKIELNFHPIEGLVVTEWEEILE
jgi:viroplasmin and RNaseH domain-containing protein